MSNQKIMCPNCNHQFAWGDAQVSEEQRAIYELSQHGHSIRAIGRMFKLHPESVRYRIKELQRNKYVAPTSQIDSVLEMHDEFVNSLKGATNDQL
jgi:DNA-binding NarL/FixJ family response regulator